MSTTCHGFRYDHAVDSRFADEKFKLLSRPTEAPTITMAVTGMVTDRGVEVMVNVSEVINRFHMASNTGDGSRLNHD